MITFRQRLKLHTAPAHQLLESHDLMQTYARANASLTEYLTTVKRLQVFWENNIPDNTALPASFHNFYQSYISALREDTGADEVSRTPTPRNEIGFFYVLIGSSLGAKIILQNYQHGNLPNKHLRVLASEGAILWKNFVAHHLTSVDTTQEQFILQASEQMFRALYQSISHT